MFEQAHLEQSRRSSLGKDNHLYINIYPAPSSWLGLPPDRNSVRIPVWRPKPLVLARSRANNWVIKTQIQRRSFLLEARDTVRLEYQIRMVGCMYYPFLQVTLFV